MAPQLEWLGLGFPGIGPEYTRVLVYPQRRRFTNRALWDQPTKPQGSLFKPAEVERWLRWTLEAETLEARSRPS